MSQLDEVVKWTKKIESELESRLGAAGRGLHEKASSVEHQLDEKLLRQLRKIATIRNKTMHEDGYVIDDLDSFENDCASAYEQLLDMDAVVNVLAPEVRFVPVVRSQSNRTVSLPFAWAILMFPFVAAWFTLKSGYSLFVRVLAFGWMGAWLVLPWLSIMSGVGSALAVSPMILLSGGFWIAAWYLWIKYPETISHKNWGSWPTIEDYWSQYPKCKTEAGTKCNNCSSRTIRNLGWVNASDNRRIYRCGQCDTVLYRTIR